MTFSFCSKALIFHLKIDSFYSTVITWTEELVEDVLEQVIYEDFWVALKNCLKIWDEEENRNRDIIS
ncbi:hypothetical protein Q3G72_005623 [Acer saccharum]|nr:hypothetical protein Q3G72_005623 [Acer saccharum]